MPKDDVDEARRKFLKLCGIASGIIALGGIGSILKVIGGPLKIPPWPKVRVANIKNLKPNKPLIFYYPLKTTPNILVKLGKSVEGGVGPDRDIVAYSQICQHQGCYVQYESNGIVMCPCHAAIYDLTDKARVLEGPALYPLPQVELEYDSETGDIYAVKMGPPVVFGYGVPGSNDVDIMLVSGELISE